ncbi:MAG: L,D-transpeptidase family protein [Phycisphaerales bacterium]
MSSNRVLRRAVIAAAALITVVAIVTLVPSLRARALGLVATGGRRFTVDERLAEFAPSVEPKLRDACAAAGAAYPPSSLILVGLKRERELRAYVPDGNGAMRLAKAWPILAASGGPGPKLREGDCQVPEGTYRIESLNPNSRFHVALRVGYPNDEDLAQAKIDGRGTSTLGGDIMIHGSDVSIGCLAMGNGAIEEVFLLAARTGIERIEVVLCPGASPLRFIGETTPAWLAARYRLLAERLYAIDAGLVNNKK